MIDAQYLGSWCTLTGRDHVTRNGISTLTAKDSGRDITVADITRMAMEDANAKWAIVEHVNNSFLFPATRIYEFQPESSTWKLVVSGGCAPTLGAGHPESRL